jgi:hypothetical protein
MTKSDEQRIIALNLDMYKMLYEEIFGEGCPELKPEHWTVASSIRATHTLFLLSEKSN